MPLMNKKKQRVIDSPPKDQNYLEERRGSKTPVLVRDSQINRNDKNLETFSQAKQAAFATNLEQTSSNHLAQKFGRTQNVGGNSIKYSAYSKHANLAKTSKYMTNVNKMSSRNEANSLNGNSTTNLSSKRLEFKGN